jgi:ferrous iron transport protein B
VQETRKTGLAERLDRLTTHRFAGYALAFLVLGGLLLWTFTVGNLLSNLLTAAFNFLHPVNPTFSGPLWGVVLNGLYGGLVAGVTLVIPYVVPFYLMLAALEDSGILTRVAFMLDSAMHRVGLHGKAIIPLILGYGCNVPAVYATRIMGTRRERLLASFAVTFAPCTARTILILGIVAAFLGPWWALALYALDLAVMMLATSLAARALPGEVTGMIMEIHAFKTPSLRVISQQTWARTKSLIYMVFPLYLVGSAAVQALYALGVLQPLNGALAFITVGWLRLPAIAGVLLILGIVRKELILLTLVAVAGSNLAAVLTPPQLMVLALVGILYLPCLATISILAREFGAKAAAAISAANLATALVAGGIMARLLPLVM